MMDYPYTRKAGKNLFKGFHLNIEGTDRIVYEGCLVRGEWVRGCFVMYQRCASNPDSFVTGIVPDYASDLYIKDVIPETVSQFIGILDKDGAEAYENQIVKREKSIGVVKFEEGRFMIDWGKNPENWSDTASVHLPSSKIEGTKFGPEGVILIPHTKE